MGQHIPLNAVETAAMEHARAALRSLADSLEGSAQIARTLCDTLVIISVADACPDAEKLEGAQGGKTA